MPNGGSPWPTAIDREAERQDERETVLATAERVLDAEGFHATDLDDAAKALHVTKLTICHDLSSNLDILPEWTARCAGAIGISWGTPWRGRRTGSRRGSTRGGKDDAGRDCEGSGRHADRRAGGGGAAMSLPDAFKGLAIPAIAAPMFLTSGPNLVVETCNAGLIGTFPALNQRTTPGFADWLAEIEGRRRPGAAPYGVNLIVHTSNPRLRADLEVVVQRRVPLVITSLGAAPDVVEAVQSYGGLVFHDVVNRRHAEKAAEAGVDGIIAVSAGAGGHGGVLNPFALVQEIRQVFGGTIVLAGAINTGAQIAAARVMGADMAYLGTRFIATQEAMVPDDYKDMVVASQAADIVYTSGISGVPANFLRPSIVAAGLDPDNLPAHGKLDMAGEARAWSTVWSAGQGVGGIADVPPARDLCASLIGEYRAAMTAAAQDPFAGAS